MVKKRPFSRYLWQLIRVPPRLVYRIGLGPLIGRMVLLLTTTGRKSGQPREIPLQYEEVDGAIYIGSARGQKADWFRNVAANPEVIVRVKSRRAGLPKNPTRSDLETYAEDRAVVVIHPCEEK